MANEKWLIYANALIEDLEAAEANAGMGAVVARTLIRYVKRCAPVDAVEVVHGQWEVKRMADIKMVEVKCSACAWLDVDTYDAVINYSAFSYCPNCGAKMDGGV